MSRRNLERISLRSVCICLVLSCFVTGCTSCSKSAAPSGGEALTVPTSAGFRVELGPREVLLADGALGFHYFPDEAISILRREPELQLLLTAGDSSYLVEGHDLQHLERATQVLEPGPSGAFDNGYAGISGAYRHSDGRLYAFYHAEDHTDELPRQSLFYSGWYGSMGVALSTDEGHSFNKLGPALTSTKPDLNTIQGESTWGVAAPSVVLDKTGKHLFAYYGEHSPGKGRRGIVIAMARADVSTDAPTPDRWKKYYEGSFEEPGLAGRDTAILEIEPRDEAAYLQPHVVYSKEHDRYIMVLNVAWWHETFGDAKQTRSGIYVAFSEDGIEWSNPEPLLIDHSLPDFGKSLSWQATILWDKGESTEGWLAYSYSDSWGPGYGLGTPHSMVGRRIRFDPEPAQ